MITSRRSGLHWMLIWGAATGLAGIPAEMAAQSGPSQPRGRLDTWMAEARASAFHASIQADPMANPVPGRARQAEAWTPAWMPAGTDSTGRIFRNTLLAAFIPMVPGMIMAATVGDDHNAYRAWAAVLGVWLLGAGVTLVSVPVTAIKTASARVVKGSVIVGAAVGSVLGALGGFGCSGLLHSVGFEPAWVVVAPCYSLIMAGFTTAVAFDP